MTKCLAQNSRKYQCMKFWPLFLAIPYLSAMAVTPDCTALKKTAEDLEKRIQKSRFGSDCDKIEAKSLGLDNKSIGFPNFAKAEGANADWDYRCKDYSALEMQLKSVENEIALLKGISNLKNEIEKGLITLKEFNDPKIATEATATFMDNLQIASTIELFLGTNNSKSENILSKMAADKSGWKDSQSFDALRQKYCLEFKSELVGSNSVCSPAFVMTDIVYNEINGMIKVGKNTERKFNRKHIEDLTDAMAIKKGKDPYSYSKLLSEIKSPEKDGLFSDEDLKTLKSLPELQGNSKFGFIKNMQSSLQNITASEKLVLAQKIPQRFSGYLTDLKSREEWEMKSKLSLVLNQYAEYPETGSDACKNAQTLDAPIEDCLKLLINKKELPQLDKAIIKDLSDEFAHGQKYRTQLDQALSKCIPDENLKYPTECDGIITTKLTELIEKANYLNALKAKHYQDNPNLFALRNFALEKLHSGECTTTSDSNITGCDQDIGTISKEAYVLSGQANDILYVLEKPKEDTDIKTICDDKSILIQGKDLLCQLTEKEPQKKTKKENPDYFQAPVDPDTRNSGGEIFGQFAQSLLQTTANFFAPAPVYQNPYTPNYPYLPPTAPAMDISTQIMTPALMTGWGNYRMTPGLPPYSSASVGGTYSPYSFGTSSYFNYPPGH